MKFYELYVDRNGFAQMVENGDHGEWATRADAEQAARDAVEMAELAQREIIRRCSGKIGWVYEDDPGIQLSQSIIERYEGGKG